MYIICVCLSSTLSRRVGALQISIIIIIISIIIIIIIKGVAYHYVIIMKL